MGNLKFIFIVSLVFHAIPSFADRTTHEAIIQCFEGFADTYSELQSYRGILHKKEWKKNGDLVHDEKIQVSFQKPHQLQLKYLNEGSSGIRNNGMTVDFNGGNTVKISLGKPKFFGALTHGVASLVLGDELPLYDPKVLDDEIFTINHGGFGYLVGAIKKVAAEVKSNPEFKFTGTVTQNQCTVEYPLQFKENEYLELKPQDSIFKIEENHRTLAYFIYDANRDQFSSFTDLFVRSKPMKIRFPNQLVYFTLTLNRKSKLPEKISMRENNTKIAEYQYTDFSIDKH